MVPVKHGETANLSNKKNEQLRAAECCWLSTNGPIMSNLSTTLKRIKCVEEPSTQTYWTYSPSFQLLRFDETVVKHSKTHEEKVQPRLPCLVHNTFFEGFRTCDVLSNGWQQWLAAAVKLSNFWITSEVVQFSHVLSFLICLACEHVISKECAWNPWLQILKFIPNVDVVHESHSCIVAAQRHESKSPWGKAHKALLSCMRMWHDEARCGTRQGDSVLSCQLTPGKLTRKDRTNLNESSKLLKLHNTMITFKWIR